MPSSLIQLKSDRNYPGLHIDTADPTSTAKSTTGYIKGMLWVNTTTNAVFICIDDTTPVWDTVSYGATKSNLTATIPPTVNDDASQGYGVGSIWIDTTNDIGYVCVDATAGAAIWKDITSTGTKHVSSTAAPSTADNSAAGYSIGSTWWNSSSNTLYVCTNPTVGTWTTLNTVKNNFTATTNPTSTDSTSNGYSIGSTWVNNVSHGIYICTNATAGSAVWTSTAGSVTIISASTPTTASAGDLWYNSSTDITYLWNGSAWIDISAAGGRLVKSNYGSAGDPTVNDDNTAGYSIGSLWVNIVSGSAYIATGVSTGAAIWERISGGVEWIVKTTNYTASVNEGIFANTSTAAWTLTLPANPRLGNTVRFVDYKGTFNTNNLTIARNGKTIMGLTQDMTVSTQYASDTLVYDGVGDWRLTY